MRELVVVGNGMAGARAVEEILAHNGAEKFIITMFGDEPQGMWADNKTLTAGVSGFRTLRDTTSMMRYACGRRSAVVIGGGLLGLEAARGLQAHGLDVHVVHAAQGLMNQQLDAQAGRVLRRSLERLGFTVHTGKRTTAIRRSTDGAATGVAFADGATLDSDMVVIAAGIRPNIGLAMVSGLETQRGIIVDDQLRSVDDDDIYAVGECVQHRGEVYGLVAPLWEQATVLADHITGADPRAAYHGSRLATKLKVAGVDVAAMGLKEPERPDDEVVQFSEPGRGIYQTVVIRDGILGGATLLGDVSKVASLTQAFDRRVLSPQERVRLLFDLGAPAAEVGAAELDDQAQVCNCNGGSKGQLVACVRDGQRTVSGVMKLAVSGCPRNCAESYVKDVGVVAVEGGRWEIYLGGAAGATVRKGDLLATWLERSYDFVPRIGLAELRAILVEDRDGIAGRLDKAMQHSVDAYRDPWQEHRQPATEGQFRDALPLIELPKVPLR